MRTLGPDAFRCGLLVGEFVGARFERVVRVEDPVQGGGSRGDRARGLLFGFFGGLEMFFRTGRFFAFAVLREDPYLYSLPGVRPVIGCGFGATDWPPKSFEDRSGCRRPCFRRPSSAVLEVAFGQLVVRVDRAFQGRFGGLDVRGGLGFDRGGVARSREMDRLPSAVSPAVLVGPDRTCIRVRLQVRDRAETACVSAPDFGSPGEALSLRIRWPTRV